MMTTHLVRGIAAAVVAALVAAGTPAPVDARVVTTEEALAGATDASPMRFDRAAIEALLARDDVRAQLETLGVDAAEARARVQALDDEQARELAAQLEQLPAGAGVLGVAFLVFVILLVTDILGLTRVFPFTRPIR